MHGYVRVGRLPSGRNGGSGKNLYEDPRTGIHYVWRRPKGRWRSRPLPLRRLGMGQSGPDWVKRSRAQVRLLQVWRTRKCDRCHQVKDVWPQTVVRYAVKKDGGGWRVRSFPIRKEDVRRPDLVGRDDKEPVVTCRCVSERGISRKAEII